MPMSRYRGMSSAKPSMIGGRKGGIKGTMKSRGTSSTATAMRNSKPTPDSDLFASGGPGQNT